LHKEIHMAHNEPDPGVQGSFPVAPQYQAQPTAFTPVERPSSVTRAVQLMYVGAALSIVGIVIAWATKSQLRDKLAEASPSLSADDIDAALTFSLVIATVIGLLAVGLWVWMAVANGAGKSWARIVSTVLGGLSVVSTLFTLSSATGTSVALQLVSLLLAIAILVLLWLPASSAYFRAQSAPKF
jgi:hypothetical protein